VHRDTSDGNTWMWIPDTTPYYAVPEWYVGSNGIPRLGAGTIPPDWYPRRPGICGDFGLALDMLNRHSAANAVLTTVRPPQFILSSLCADFCRRGHSLLEPLPLEVNLFTSRKI
jgi:hypothetical protein